ncbi:MAG TPA: signal peptidase I [Solirubrobacteraceae bacterium]|nr:signal peptidase I [Solirubrobacteraceae bacterium]
MSQKTSPTGSQDAERVGSSEPPEQPADGRVGGRSPFKRRSKQQKTTLGSLVELVVIIVIALGLALAIQAFIVKPYRIPSGSMEPTLSVGQRVLVDRLGGDFSEPHVGEIAVFHPPSDAEKQVCGGGGAAHIVKYGGAACQEAENSKSSVNFIKRIVAGPGDTLAIVEGHVIRNGMREKDSYIKPCEPHLPQCNFPTAIKIPPGHWFMMGDNRGESDDSRFWGPVPRSWIIGDAFATYWPIDRIGLL